MKQIDLTSKVVLAIIGLTSVGAVLIPTYAVPTIRSGDIFDGEVKTADLANGAVTNSKIATDAVTTSKIKNGEVTTDDIKDATIQAGDIAAGVIPDGGGAIQFDTTRRFEGVTMQPGGLGEAFVRCEDGEIAIGGGFATRPNVEIDGDLPSDPDNPEEGEGWIVTAINHGSTEATMNVFVECMKLVS
jgi:hypothetical protein